ncbi:hypothetical protein BDY17DRAFT_324408 [Neohortaea acidophila]|uniref:Uncharacterized protein n=1 Tax=Neohortaea acidophila TaxID=245834 RepID=A0A6A6PVD5_9PEZI|nr:uncharacterized protein BDY17DRAFT_324408 [Neohortaea acidophila]KAF2483694.1 hypothetical protein BDY17DRAFT_324408 [Neohortaea acidophila]
MRLFHHTALALASAVSAAQAAKDPSAVHFHLGLNLNVQPSGVKAVYEKVPIEMYRLTNIGNVRASEIAFRDTSSKTDGIQCRAYIDSKGTEPIGTPFTNANTVILSKSNIVKVSAVLCYYYEDASPAAPGGKGKHSKTITQTGTKKHTAMKTKTKAAHSTAKHHTDKHHTGTKASSYHLDTMTTVTKTKKHHTTATAYKTRSHKTKGHHSKGEGQQTKGKDHHTKGEGHKTKGQGENTKGNSDKGHHTKGKHDATASPSVTGSVGSTMEE